MTVRLIDGSVVTLAPRSKLHVSEDFGRTVRTVVLDGQGYFEVGMASGAPFIVHTGNTTTKVLGTSFDVKHYRGEPATRVSVVAGKVTSSNTKGRAVTLGAGMVGRITDSTALSTAVGNVTEYGGWTRGQLAFRETPALEMLATLERWYGVHFRLTDVSLGDATVTGRFDYRSTENLMDVLEMLLNVSATFDRSGNTTIVTLHPMRAGNRVAPVKGHMLDSITLSQEVGR